MGMDHYKIIKQLGGTTGSFLAVDKQDESKKVVIKRLMDGTQGMQELNVSLWVRHSNIVTFLESFVHDGGLYVVLAYAEGGDLEAYLKEMSKKKKTLSRKLLLRWFKQLIEALQCCHEQHILHRDVKPGNVFLNADKTELYLGDFGSAKSLLQTASLTTTFVGTPVCISPEVMTGTPYSYPADIWSLGCVFYEMAALRRPFSSTSFADLVQQVTSGDIAPFPAFVPEDIRMIIMSMLQVDPRKRCSLGDALKMTERAACTHTFPEGKKAIRCVAGEKTPQSNVAKPSVPNKPNFCRLPTRRSILGDETTVQNGVKFVEKEPRAEVYAQKLTAWACARNHDADIICGYLNKFRKIDEQVLTAAPPLLESPPQDVGQQRLVRMKSNVTFSAHLDVAPPRLAKRAARNIVSPQLRVAYCKVGVRAYSRNGTNVNCNASPALREHSSNSRSISNNALRVGKLFQRTSSRSRGNLPQQSSPQVEKERRLLREKREQERTKMLEMIREQKAKMLQERKARGKNKARDAVAVEIVLPVNGRHVYDAAQREI